MSVSAVALACTVDNAPGSGGMGNGSHCRLRMYWISWLIADPIPLTAVLNMAVSPAPHTAGFSGSFTIGSRNW